MSCLNCNGDMIGDGYTTVMHCEYADEDTYESHEPDAAPVYCDLVEAVEEVYKHHVSAGKYDLGERSCQWADSFETLDEAIKQLKELHGYAWAELRVVR